jgi:hypothetical protein
VASPAGDNPRRRLDPTAADLHLPDRTRRRAAPARQRRVRPQHQARLVPLVEPLLQHRGRHPRRTRRRDRPPAALTGHRPDQRPQIPGAVPPAPRSCRRHGPLRGHRHRRLRRELQSRPPAHHRFPTRRRPRTVAILGSHPAASPSTGRPRSHSTAATR